MSRLFKRNWPLWPFSVWVDIVPFQAIRVGYSAKPTNHVTCAMGSARLKAAQVNIISRSFEARGFRFRAEYDIQGNADC